MRMLCTGIHIKVAIDGVAKLGLGKHALDGVLENGLRLFPQLLAHVAETLATRITGVMHIVLFSHLVAGELNLIGIDDDDIVATIAVGSDPGLSERAVQR